MNRSTTNRASFRTRLPAESFDGWYDNRMAAARV